MDRERQTVLLVVGFIAFCFTALVVLVFASLWPDRAVVAWVLLAVFGVLALTLVGGKINEMYLRHIRYHHRDETPLDAGGSPVLATWDICSENLRRRKPLINEDVLNNQAENRCPFLSVGEKQDKEHQNVQYPLYDGHHNILCQVFIHTSKVYAAL